MLIWWMEECECNVLLASDIECRATCQCLSLLLSSMKMSETLLGPGWSVT